MVEKWLLGGLLVLFLAACQPDVIEVEVTRLVEVEQLTKTAVPPTTAALSTPAPQIIEVTRIVIQEVVAKAPAEAPVNAALSLGSSERPVQLLFPPDAGTAVINLRGQ
ncbi:MAG: hypothetical protein IAF02_28905, partial [Anaerolineae bacterium]|nr:hypothetical protein [Anaerolineae bacterium]